MIIIKTLEFNNWFSYGEGNKLVLDEPLVQVKGKNGHGKSSIAFILQELYYGKNTKGIKKQALLNRKKKGETLWAKSTFTDGHNDYEIELSRNSTLSLVLRGDGTDLSSHTSTDTYKEIEQILGMDFKTFAQLTYQSSKSSLQFLTTTDTLRKNFLVSLFNLQEYTELYELFKSESRNLTKDVAVQDGKIETITAWIRSHEGVDLEEWNEKPLQEIPSWYSEHIAKHRLDLSTLNEQNKKISANNTYIEMREALDMDDLVSEAIDYAMEIYEEDVQLNKTLVAECKSRLKAEEIKQNQVQKEVDDWNKVPDICDKCNQSWPEAKDYAKMEELDIKKNSYIDECVIINDELHGLECELIEAQSQLEIALIGHKEFERCKAVKEEFERLNAIIDNTLSADILDKDAISSKIKTLQKDLKQKQLDNDDRIEHNKGVAEHNSKIKVIQEQLIEYNKTLEDEFEVLGTAEDKLDKVDILKKAFSSTGLITYKLEYLVKDLEKEINSYLLIFSSGRFQLEFNLKGEKLNIDIIDDGEVVSVEALSEGELSRVNVSTLLSIRKMMSHISSTKINFLFLDEIMGVLDTEGKDNLIDVLLKEELNTYLVSHDYEHPLVPSLYIVKENKESRIE